MIYYYVDPMENATFVSGSSGLCHQVRHLTSMDYHISLLFLHIAAR